MPDPSRSCALDPQNVAGRFAPSPTGLLHLGNARTALLAWLWARSASGRFAVRIEDLDGPRCRPQLESGQLADLAWLGLDWDEGPSVEPPHQDTGPHGPYRQSQRTALYREAVARLRERDLAYECFCSRAEVRSAARPSEASAPHGPADDGPRYPGTCAGLTRDQRAERARTRAPALRLRVPAGPVDFDDAIAGPQRFDPAAEVGDFVVQRADGLHAYQLAVVVDDAAMAVTQVLRGADLLPSTARQLQLYTLLGLRPPRFAHAPLLYGPSGPGGAPQRLSKREGADTLAGLRSGGADPRRVVAGLARSAGLDAGLDACTPSELIACFRLESLRSE